MQELATSKDVRNVSSENGAIGWLLVGVVLVIFEIVPLIQAVFSASAPSQPGGEPNTFAHISRAVSARKLLTGGSSRSRPRAR
jgi:hypothetical protein